MTCFVCGKSVPQIYTTTRFGNIVSGRPRTYCSDHCRNFMKYFVAMQKELDLIDLDDEHKRKIRGELFRLANTLKLSSSRTIGTKTNRSENK